MSTAPTHSTNQAAPSRFASRLAHIGLIPFVSGTLFVWLLGPRLDREPFMFVVHGVTAYAALVTAFLGGLLWGMLIRQIAHEPLDENLQRRALLAGMGYVLASLIAILMPPHAGLALIGFTLIACYLIDRKLYAALNASGWLTLRFRLTGLACLCCFMSAAQI